MRHPLSPWCIITVTCLNGSCQAKGLDRYCDFWPTCQQAQPPPERFSDFSKPRSRFHEPVLPGVGGWLGCRRSHSSSMPLAGSSSSSCRSSARSHSSRSFWRKAAVARPRSAPKQTNNKTIKQQKQSNKQSVRVMVSNYADTHLVGVSGDWFFQL